LAEARRQLAGVDVGLLDLDLPDGSGIDLVKELTTANPDGAVLILTADADRRTHARAVAAGAAAVLHKSLPLPRIFEAIRRAGAGEALLSGAEFVELVQLAAEWDRQQRDAQRAIGSLTAREREALQAMAEGLNDRAIAGRMQISIETARTHSRNILSKLE